ncbi:MAG: alpha hydrolase, partial [Methanomicrobiales archaeon]|nr:alpha hydrolase [Methanomicrobiales archaeon]
MRAGVLFSGGKDSALAALLLARDYDVELNSFVFDTNRVIPDVQAAADAVGLPFRRWVFKSGLLETAVEIVIAHGYPNQAITMVHKEAIAALTAEYSVVGDGTRLNDR